MRGWLARFDLFTDSSLAELVFLGSATSRSAQPKALLAVRLLVPVMSCYINCRPSASFDQPPKVEPYGDISGIGARIIPSEIQHLPPNIDTCLCSPISRQNWGICFALVCHTTDSYQVVIGFLAPAYLCLIIMTIYYVFEHDPRTDPYRSAQDPRQVRVVGRPNPIDHLLYGWFRGLKTDSVTGTPSADQQESEFSKALSKVC